MAVGTRAKDALGDPFAGMPRLRPHPWPVTPYGPYRLLGDGSLERFETDGPKVIRWIERNCVLTKDRWRGKPFVMMQWQKQLLIDLFELAWDEDLGRLRRRYRTAYIGVPKKQAKTELVAALAVYFLLGSGEPDPKIPVAAAADTQADLVFAAATAMIELSPTLKGRAQLFKKEILVPGESGSWIRRVPANGGKFDGQGTLAPIGDELHEWLTFNQRKMFGMLSGSTATREEPLQIYITTAGEDEGDEDDEYVAPWLRMYRIGRRLESGETVDESFFFRWWMAPETRDYRDLDAYADPSVNPSFGETVGRAFYASELTKRTSSEMRRYYFNQPVEAITAWLEPGAWEACQADIEWDPKEPTWVGWDASTKRDSTAVVSIQWRELAGHRRLLVKSKIWERPLAVDGRALEDWRVPRSEVLDYVVAEFETGNIVSCGYDPYFITWIVEELENRGLALVEVPQNDGRMSPGTQALYELITERVLAYKADAPLSRHVKAAKVRNSSRGQRLVKDPNGRGRKIDGAIALVLAITESMEAAPVVEPAFYSFPMGEEEQE
jgi:phage terminase large subunit-like protein